MTYCDCFVTLTTAHPSRGVTRSLGTIKRSTDIPFCHISHASCAAFIYSYSRPSTITPDCCFHDTGHGPGHLALFTAAAQEHFCGTSHLPYAFLHHTASHSLSCSLSFFLHPYLGGIKRASRPFCSLHKPPQPCSSIHLHLRSPHWLYYPFFQSLRLNHQVSSYIHHTQFAL